MPPPTTPPADAPALFAAERSRLLDLLGELWPEDWERPTPCPGWDVRGLCTHLLGDDLSVLARHRDGHQGTEPPPGVDDAGFVAWFDAMQQEWVHAACRLSPRLVVDLLGWTADQVVDLLRAQDPRQRTAQVWWAGPDPVPVWLDQLREVSEHWIHRQQLLQALDRPSELQPRVVRPLLDALFWAFPHQLRQVPAEPGDTVEIEVEGPLTATWLLVATEQGWDFQPEPGARLAARLCATTEQAWRLVTGNLHAEDEADLDLSGDEPITRAIRRTRAIIGAPASG